MRRLLLVIMATLGLILGFSASPALASDNVNVGNTCNLSANWVVQGSVNYDNTGRFNELGDPIAFVDYVVVNSPGPLSAVTIDVGRLVDDGGDVHGTTFSVTVPNGASPPRYIARRDPNVDRAFTVAIHVHGGSGACIINLDPPGI